MSTQKGKGNLLENLALISQIGISMIIPIIGGLYIGRWLDTKVGTQPIFLFVFIVMGVGAAFVNLFKITTKDVQKNKRK
ncbi:AtpZ/AtpI family protein [Clostridium formicaceticum]|uniref:ATP synthase subunit n=1 Tax=Clostridium formicaceticum TaxID=1497 RepID=A0AAC9RKE4_9CLOT|nr:AtpZ/AtpI family protein [Clostridium formicaceticum]AOY75576.1 ATP synthase subunit [Clostridium formicaceticum]ARE85880.1 Putative F0F1-ATPase subunit (ATPase_gene1) [Clostridium formicaceticum]